MSKQEEKKETEKKVVSEYKPVCQFLDAFGKISKNEFVHSETLKILDEYSVRPICNKCSKRMNQFRNSIAVISEGADKGLNKESLDLTYWHTYTSIQRQSKMHCEEIALNDHLPTPKKLKF